VYMYRAFSIELLKVLDSELLGRTIRNNDLTNITILDMLNNK